MTNRTKQLEKLKQAEVQERRRDRDAESAAHTAKQEAERARDALVEAHAGGEARAIKSAEKARANALAQAEDASVRAEGAKLRSNRVARERQAFEAEHGRELIAELEPAAIEAAEAIKRAAAELIGADAEWSTVCQRMSDLLAAIPDASPAADLDETHGLAEIVRLLRRESAEVAAPLPHWRGANHHTSEQRRVQTVKAAREGKVAA